MRHEYGAFWERSSNQRSFKTSDFCFRVDGKHIENGAFRTIILRFPLSSFPHTEIQNERCGRRLIFILANHAAYQISDGLTEGDYTEVLAPYLADLDAHGLYKVLSSLRMSLLNKA